MMNAINVIVIFLIYISSSNTKAEISNPASLIHRLKREVSVCKRQKGYPCIQNGKEDVCYREIVECCDGYVLKDQECVRCDEVGQCPTPSSIIPTASTLVITKCSPGLTLSYKLQRRGALRYKENSPCKWVIEGPPGSTIKIKTNEISLPERTMNFVCLWSWTCIVFVCQSASIRFTDNMRESSTPYCSKETVPLYTSLGNRVTINFINHANAHSVIDLSYEIIGGVEPTVAMTTPSLPTTRRLTTIEPTTRWQPPSSTWRFSTSMWRPTTTPTSTTRRLPITTRRLTTTTTKPTTFRHSTTSVVTWRPSTTTRSPTTTLRPTIVTRWHTTTTSRPSNAWRPTTTTTRRPTVTTLRPTTTTKRPIVVTLQPTTFTRRPATTTADPTIQTICEGGMVWTVSRTNCRYMCNDRLPERICSYHLSGGVRTPNTYDPGCECPASRKYVKNETSCVSREECVKEGPVTQRPNKITYSYPTESTVTTTETTTEEGEKFPFFFFTYSTTTPQVMVSQRSIVPIPTSRPEYKTTRKLTTYPTTTLPPPSKVKCGIQKVHPVLKIYGGSTTEKGTWPWAVQVLKRKFTGSLLVCGGALLCNQFVLTAAHCFLDKNYYSVDMSIYSLVIGKHANLFQRETEPGLFETFDRFRFFPHPKYTFLPKNQFDIALLKLPKPVTISDTIRPACVPTDPLTSFRDSAKAYDDCVAVGWGKTEERAYGSNTQLRSRALKQVTLQILPNERCTFIFANYMKSHHLCAIGKTRQDDTCGGDSGGPLMCKRNNRWYLDGLVSYGLNCAEGDPGVYTRVGVYRQWIKDTITKEGGNKNCINLETMYQSTTEYKK